MASRRRCSATVTSGDGSLRSRISGALRSASRTPISTGVPPSTSAQGSQGSSTRSKLTVVAIPTLSSYGTNHQAQLGINAQLILATPSPATLVQCEQTVVAKQWGAGPAFRRFLFQQQVNNPPVSDR